MTAKKKVVVASQPRSIPEIFGLKPDMTSRIINQPDDYEAIMNGWLFTKPVTTNKTKIDFGHLFVHDRAELTEWLPILKEQLNSDGMIWVSWPKKSSNISTDVSDNTVRSLALDIGLVDIKVCAVSDVWSGLKLVIRRRDRV